MPKGDRLTARQRKWAFEYLTTDNASQAALNAGYAHRQMGDKNMTKGVVERFLAELGDTAGAMEKTSPDALFSQCMDMAINAENDGTRARCLELAMRAKGMFVSSVEITDKTQDIEGMLTVLEAEKPQLAAVLRQELGLTQELKH